jgi:LPXTG-motif cell wall-anchored protein
MPLDTIACSGAKFDGSYWVLQRAGTLGPNKSTTFTWYYGAGPKSVLDSMTKSLYTVSQPRELPPTGSGSTAPLAVWGLAALAAGGGIVIHTRRNRRRRATAD